MDEPIEYTYKIKYHFNISVPGPVIKEFWDLASKLKIEKEKMWGDMNYKSSIEIKAISPEKAKEIVQEDLEKRVNEALELPWISISVDNVYMSLGVGYEVDQVLNMEFYNLVERKISGLFSPPTGDNREYHFTNEVATSISEIARTREEAEVAMI